MGRTNNFIYITVIFSYGGNMEDETNDKVLFVVLCLLLLIVTYVSETYLQIIWLAFLLVCIIALIRNK